MKAVPFHEFGELPELADVPMPECPATGAVIRVRATGLCRSDWHGWMGHDPGIRLPHVPGHEFAGVIESVGARVTGWAVGDRVTVPFVCACGTCEQCLLGNQQVCDNQEQPGFTQWGSFAEFVAIAGADTNLVALPADLDFVSAAALGCRFATAYRAVMTQGRVQAGEWVAVHGCGGVGLSAIMIAVAAGAKVVAVDVSADALAIAEQLGAIPMSGTSDVTEAIRERTQGGAHLSLDALGSLTTSGNSIRSLRKRGRHVQVGLMLGPDALSPVPMDLVVANELEILGSHGMAAHEYPAMLASIARGDIDPRMLVGRTISLDDAPEALATMDAAAHPGMTVITLP
ncbi:alcohol dehydrogenase [Cryobacterium mesophilum]|uniref:Alcohol dehydrogenase n=1 Tax=Terrimesophilobacter mesophilus TaxID=433647 RepID=A0A4R8VEK3_9MICO|nr:zinc-dependent alcohol dehydrogenase family protein [Terrimesophilobacter mesophilus]MBB5633925.1 alcohol dehydrogenase [Terrimesophilobacter mesophilus]TFB80592.1 alcohol dehydrogenase [Terrimesophilobacter mesophilus]